MGILTVNVLSEELVEYGTAFSLVLFLSLTVPIDIVTFPVRGAEAREQSGFSLADEDA